MIYTIGRTESYEQLFRDHAHEPQKVQKLGRNPAQDYVGGSVWKTREEAERCCPVGFSVYGVLADWDRDTAPSADSFSWHDLLVDSPLVRLGDPSPAGDEEAVNTELKAIGEPTVYLVGKTDMSRGALDAFLKDHGVNWETDADEPAEVLTEVAGRLCYMSFGKPRPGGHAAYVERILSEAHGSVLEHAVFNLIATGVSRNLTHELVRHRAGWAYSQLSTRFVDARGLSFVIDRLIGQDADCMQAWSGVMRAAADAYDLIDQRLYAKLTEDYLQQKYPEAGPHTEKMLTTDEKTSLRKKSREAARQVLPGCLETKITMSFNVRALRHFLEMRASPGAAWEIRRLANRIYEAVLPHVPTLLEDYQKEFLPDGTYALKARFRKV